MLIETLYGEMANWVLLLVSLLAFLVIGRQMQITTKNFRSGRDPTVVKLEMAYDKKSFAKILKKWMNSKGDEAVLAFRRQLWLDNLWAISYAVLLSSLIALLTIRPEQRPNTFFLLLFVLPILAGFLDIFPENMFYLLLLRDVRSSDQLEDLNSTPILIASIAAIIKFLLLGLAITCIILLILYKLFHSVTTLPSVYTAASSWLVVAISMMLALLYVGALFPQASRQYRGKKDPQIISLQLAFSKARFTKVLRAWHLSRGSAAIPMFRKSIKQLDFVFPIVYAIFFASTIAALSSDPGQAPDQRELLLFLLPFIAALFDYIENLIHLKILKGVDSWQEIESIKPGPIVVASFAALFKWALVTVSFFAIVAHLIF